MDKDSKRTNFDDVTSMETGNDKRGDHNVPKQKSIKGTKVSMEERRAKYKRGSIVDRYRRASAFDEIVKDTSEKAAGASGDRIEKIQSTKKLGLGQDARARMVAFETAAAQIKRNEGGEEAFEDDEWALNPYCVASMPEDIRRGFLRKVFGIVLVQILVMTIGIICVKYTPLGEFIRDTFWFVIVAYVLPYVFIALLMAVRKMHPWNIISFCLFTLSLSLMLGFIAYLMPSDLGLFVSLGGIILETVVIMAYTQRPLEKFTCMNCALVIFGVGLATSLLGFIAYPGIAWYYYFWPGIAAVVFGLWIIWDIVAIQIDLTPDEYIIGALDIYLDIVNLLIWLLICFLYCLETISKVAH